MRRLDKVRGEFRLSALVSDLKRVIHIVGLSPLLEKLKALRKPERGPHLSSNPHALWTRLGNLLIRLPSAAIAQPRPEPLSF